MGELIVIAVIALVLFGKDDLPSTIRNFAKWISGAKETAKGVQRSFYEMRDDVTKTIMKEVEEKEVAATEKAVTLKPSEVAVPRGSSDDGVEEKVSKENQNSENELERISKPDGC